MAGGRRRSKDEENIFPGERVGRASLFNEGGRHRRKEEGERTERDGEENTERNGGLKSRRAHPSSSSKNRRYCMASSGDRSDSSSEYFSPMQSPSVSATPQSPAAPATLAAAAGAMAPQSHAAATASTPAAAATGAETPAAAAVEPEIPVAAAATETQMSVSVTVTLLVTVLGVILTVFVASGHPRRGIRYLAYVVTGLLSLTLVLLVVGGWLGRPQVIRVGRNLVWFVVAGAIVFALFVYSS